MSDMGVSAHRFISVGVEWVHEPADEFQEMAEVNICM